MQALWKQQRTECIFSFDFHLALREDGQPTTKIKARNKMVLSIPITCMLRARMHLGLHPPVHVDFSTEESARPCRAPAAQQPFSCTSHRGVVAKQGAEASSPVHIAAGTLLSLQGTENERLIYVPRNPRCLQSCCWQNYRASEYVLF